MAAKDAKDIVVTGTLIRGIAPVGSNVASVSREQIELSGTTDGNALLTNLVPQSEGFMDVGLLQPGRGGANSLGLPRVPVVRPSLRNLGDSFQGSGSPTLVLLDGHRIVPAGIDQSVVDVGLMPPGLMERQDIILDGTSAVYGSDAVGGTINYILRKRFDETRVSATYGIADNHYNMSADVATGLTWGSGGIAFAYSFGKNDAILQRERDYAIPRNYLDGGRLTGLACETYGHITVPGTTPPRIFPTDTLREGANWCNLGYNTFAQALERHSGFVTLSQDVSDRVKFEVSGFFSQRTSQANNGPFTSSVTVRTTNPYFRSIPGVANGNQTVAFSWGPIFGNKASVSETRLRVGQVSPSLSIDLDDNWQVRLLGAYGKSHVTVDQTLIDTTLVNTLVSGTAIANAINPYDINATQTRSLFGNLLWHNIRDGVHTFQQARAITDGSLFVLPGGEVRVAFGAEWIKTDFKRRITDPTTHILGPYGRASVTNMAVFGEVNLPIVGSGNSMPGINSLTLAASARYDAYKDSENSFNPKVALTWKPVDWVSLRGNWGTSFRAPNAVDRQGAGANDIRCGGVSVPGCTNSSPDYPAGRPLPPGTLVSVFVSGTRADLKPETSKNWAIGGDVRPPFIPGLMLSGTYWHISFKDQIRMPPTNTTTMLAVAPHLVTVDPTPAQLDAFANLAPNGRTLIDFVRASGYTVGVLKDITLSNLAAAEVSGLDAAARYTLPTSFGSIDANLSGTWALTRKVQTTALAPINDELAFGAGRFRLSATLGTTIGNLRAQVSLQHRDGYPVEPSANTDPTQTHIDSYQIVNAAFRYNVNGSGPLTKGLTFSFVVNNVFDNAPPIARSTNGSATNGSTIGRYIQFGIEKTF